MRRRRTAAAIARGMRAPTPEAAGMSAATTVAAAMLRKGGLRRQPKRTNRQNQDREIEKPARPPVALHFGTLSPESRGTHQRFYLM